MRYQIALLIKQVCTLMLHASLQVEVSDGSQLPVKLVSYWKCESATTNFRLDYTYHSSTLPSFQKPPLTSVSIVVPVNGGVRNMLSKPAGTWSGERQQMAWNIGEVAASDDSSPGEGGRV